MHRLIRSLSLAGCLGVCVSGCATVSPDGCIDCTPSSMHLHHKYMPWFDDMLTKHTAKKCACRHLAAYAANCGQPVTKDFRRGFEQAFEDVAMGAPEAVPAVAPSRYWQAYYRSGAGRPLVEEWFDGYATGLDYATSSQAAELNRVASTDKPYLTPEEQHGGGNTGGMAGSGWSQPPVIAPQAAPVMSVQPPPNMPPPQMPSYQLPIPQMPPSPQMQLQPTSPPAHPDWNTTQRGSDWPDTTIQPTSYSAPAGAMQPPVGSQNQFTPSQPRGYPQPAPFGATTAVSGGFSAPNSREMTDATRPYGPPPGRSVNDAYGVSNPRSVQR
ncbi:MAG: hypothetical protein C0478_10165 [Planctomyces sp.]|nr:hypothetical protein [Planctomyces sp.]